MDCFLSPKLHKYEAHVTIQQAHFSITFHFTSDWWLVFYAVMLVNNNCTMNRRVIILYPIITGCAFAIFSCALHSQKWVRERREKIKYIMYYTMHSKPFMSSLQVHLMLSEAVKKKQELLDICIFFVCLHLQPQYVIA